MEKRNLTLIISGIICAILGLALVYIILLRCGFNLIEWLGTKWGITVIIAISLFLIIGIIIYVSEKIRRI